MKNSKNVFMQIVQFSQILLPFFVILFFQNNEVFAQPNTSSSTNQNEKSKNKGVMFGPTHQGNNNHQHHNHQGNSQYPQPNTCFEDQKFWQEGRWEYPNGRRIWVPGHWNVRRVAVPCPPPNYPPPNNYSGNPGCLQPTMSYDQFRQALQTVQNRNFESAKMDVVRQIVVNNCLSSMQVRDLMMVFSFDSNRLEVAKQSYQYTCDKYNYYMVNDAFSFDSSVQELARFLQAQPR